MSTTTMTSRPTQQTSPNHQQPSADKKKRLSIATYTRVELIATLRRPDTAFFTILMPLGMYLLFGTMGDFETTSTGHGNVTASIMINMSTYSAALSATAIAASAAVEQIGGWGRQIALTPGGLRAYFSTKVVSAILISSLPIFLIFITGALTGARMDDSWRWVASFLLALSAAIPFSCFGLAVGLWVPSQTAVSVASASVVAFGFLGNIFMPLSGTLFTLSHFSPISGVGALASRPLQGDAVVTMDGIVREPLWYSVTNMVGWTLVFILVAAAARRRSTIRK